MSLSFVFTKNLNSCFNFRSDYRLNFFFFRSCALFLRHATNVSPHESLERDDNFDDLCHYLGMPTDILSYFDVNGQTGLDPLVQRYENYVLLVRA